jgi:uncharacterized protein (TIGR02118 family)
MIVSVIYQLAPGQTFDLDYYMKSHTPMVNSLLGPEGLKSLKILKGTGTPDGKPAAVEVIALLEFDSMAKFGAAMDKHGAAVLGDIPKFTNTQPSIQFNEPLT